MTDQTAMSTLVPSRHDNPFATCWTKPGALAFRFTDGQTVENLLKKLAHQNWWGEIVGPHGSGKSTLLEILRPALIASGRRVHGLTLCEGQHKLPRDFFNTAGDVVAEPSRITITGSAELPASDTSCLFIVDGYEQLGWLERWRLKQNCRRVGAGLIVTSHAPTGLPELIQLVPDRALVHQLVSDLCANASTGVTPGDVHASHASHGSNVREILFDLYDRHEARRRAARTDDGAKA